MPYGGGGVFVRAVDYLHQPGPREKHYLFRFLLTLGWLLPLLFSSSIALNIVAGLAGPNRV